jgi:hypothetical protein
MLPLLPKTANGPSMLTLKVLPQTGEFRPIGSQPSSARVLSFTPVPVVSTPSLVMPVVQQQPHLSQPLVEKVQKHPLNIIPAVTTVPISVASPPHPLSLPTSSSPPPSITSLLNLGPEELSLGADSTTLLDVPLATSAPNFVGKFSIDYTLNWNNNRCSKIVSLKK